VIEPTNPNHRLRRHEVFDGLALKSNRREDCVQMPGKMTAQALCHRFGLPALMAAVRAIRLSCQNGEKAQ